MNIFKMPDFPDDDINPSKIDFKRMIKILLIIISIIIFSYILIYLFSILIISNLSIENEKKYFWNLFKDYNIEKIDLSKIEPNLKLENWIETYLNDSKEVNAYALIWWNIVFTKWLFENIKTKEEFLFILWHEIWHIKSRDPIKALSRELPFYIIMSFLGFQENTDYDKFLEVTSNYFSRKVEIKADNYWIEFLNKLWLDASCALNFFENKTNTFSKYLQISSTHPSNIDRIENIKKQNKVNKKCSNFIY